MTRMATSAAGRWFRGVLWLGILVNLGLAATTLLWPAAMLARNSLPPSDPVLWPRFAALLLILLTLFYAPAAIDPDRYRANAWMAVTARLAGVVFFFAFQAAAYRTLGLVDLVFLVPQAILFAAALRGAHGPAMAGQPRTA